MRHICHSITCGTYATALYVAHMPQHNICVVDNGDPASQVHIRYIYTNIELMITYISAQVYYTSGFKQNFHRLTTNLQIVYVINLLRMCAQLLTLFRMCALLLTVFRMCALLLTLLRKCALLLSLLRKCALLLTPIEHTVNKYS